MDLQTVLLVISVVILSIIMLMLIGAVIVVMLVRKRIKQLPIGKFGGLMSLLPVLKFVLSRRQQARRY
jgi:hypothetical protein